MTGIVNNLGPCHTQGLLAGDTRLSQQAFFLFTCLLGPKKLTKVPTPETLVHSLERESTPRKSRYTLVASTISTNKAFHPNSIKSTTPSGDVVGAFILVRPTSRPRWAIKTYNSRPSLPF
jgi:hypothetical protein